MGLLDSLFGNADQTQALGLLGANMMAGNTAQGFAQMQGLLAQAPEKKRQAELQQMEMEQRRMAMEEMRRKQAMEQQFAEAARSSYRTPQQANAQSMGPMPDGSAMPQVAPGFDSQGFLQRAYGIDPMRAIQLEQSLTKDSSPISVAPGASLVDRRTMKPVFTAPKDAPAPPAAIQEYQFAVNQGYKGTFDQWDRDRKKAGASNVSVAVSTEKNLLNGLADGFSKGIVEAKGGAQAALGTISTVGRLNDALDTNKVIAGPGTTFRQFGLQVGNMLGVGGKDAQEKLLNTRQAVQSLAQLELDAAQQMKGQGQITEAERSIIRRAASGDIDGMTTGELRLLGGVLDRSARTKIRGYNAQVAPLKNMPNASALTPFLDVQEPVARKTPGVMRFDAQGNLIP